MQNLREGLGKQNLESCLGAAQLVTARPQGTRSEVLSAHGEGRGLTVFQLGCSLNTLQRPLQPVPWVARGVPRGGGHRRGKKSY